MNFAACTDRKRKDMTYIKMCGLRREEDVLSAVKCGADLTGFILTARYWRSISEEKLRELKKLIPEGIKAVGVFVDEPVEYPARLLKEGVIDIAQLHGQEDEVYMQRLREMADLDQGVKLAGGRQSAQIQPGDIRIIKAIKVTDANDVKKADSCAADMVLLDSGTGTGRTFDWSLIRSVKRPFLLAGGLEPGNAAQAVESIRPWGVDVSSGIETDRVKDPQKMKAFAGAVREADQPETEEA